VQNDIIKRVKERQSSGLPALQETKTENPDLVEKLTSLINSLAIPPSTLPWFVRWWCKLWKIPPEEFLKFPEEILKSSAKSYALASTARVISLWAKDKPSIEREVWNTLVRLRHSCFPRYSTTEKEPQNRCLASFLSQIDRLNSQLIKNSTPNCDEFYNLSVLAHLVSLETPPFTLTPSLERLPAFGVSRVYTALKEDWERFAQCWKDALETHMSLLIGEEWKSNPELQALLG